MEYRESLEERGLKSSEEIERKVSLHRKRLEVDCGLSEGPSLSGRDRDSKGGDLGSERGFLRSSGGFQVHIIVITCTRYQQVLCSCGGCCSSYAH